MIVTVDEARHHHGALQVDDLRALRHTGDLCIRPHSDNPSVLHGQSGELPIKPYRVCHGDHAGGVEKHGVRTQRQHAQHDRLLQLLKVVRSAYKRVQHPLAQ